MSDDKSQPQSKQPKMNFNIPLGNSSVKPDEVVQVDISSGNRFKDVRAAVSRIDVVNDLQHIGEIPCARNSLLYGIAGGAGIGAVRFLGSRRVLSAANWAVGTFVAVSIIRWETCRRARAKELAQMRLIQERFPHRHVSNLKKSRETVDNNDSSSSNSS